MYDIYESKYGIYNHLQPDPNRPLASVAMHECEDFTSKSVTEGVIRTYAKKGIMETFGLNLEQFMNLPMDIADMLVLIADEERASKNKTISEVEKSLKYG